MLSAATSTILAPPILSLTPPSPKTVPRVRFRPVRAFAASSTYASAESTASTASYLSSPHEMTSLYGILGIPTAATCQEIKSAYRRLARVCHPDVAAIERKDTSADEFMRIHTAYSTLSDPEKRADYDRKLLRRIRPPLTSASGYSGYCTRRNWETDQCW